MVTAESATVMAIGLLEHPLTPLVELSRPSVHELVGE